MSSSPETTQQTMSQHKRGVGTNDDAQAPAPKPHQANKPGVDQLLETMKFQHKQIQKAMAIWIRLKGGEDKLGDANTNVLGIIKSALYNGNLAMKLVEKQEVDQADRDNQIEKRLKQMKVSLESRQQENFARLRDDLEGDFHDAANDVSDNLMFSARFAEAISNAVAKDADITCDDEWVEIKKFVIRQMKLAKDAPESSQDVLLEHQAETGF